MFHGLRLRSTIKFLGRILEMMGKLQIRISIKEHDLRSSNDDTDQTLRVKRAP
jgi:hypothetical protein